MPWRRIFRALIIPAAGFLLNLGVFVLSRTSSRLASPMGLYVSIVTGAAAAACAIALVALPAGAALMLRVMRFSQEGYVPPFRAFLFTCRLARIVHAVVAVGVTMTFAATFILISGPERMPLAVALAAVVGAGFLMHLLSAGPGENLDAVFLPGRVIAIGDAPALHALAEPAARKVGATLPRHVVLGLGPGVYCLQRDVAVGGDVLEGGAIYLSLPMCRVLDRGELAGLLAFEIAREHAYIEARRQSIGDARARITHLLSHRPAESPAREAFAGAFFPLQLWSEMLGGLDLAIWRGALQGGAVAAGRETMASAVSIHLLCQPAWESFVIDLQLELRGAAFDQSHAENLSEQLTHRCRAFMDGPGFLRPFDSIDALNAAHPLLGLLVGSLGVEPPSVAARLRSVPADPAIDVIAGATDIERELSITAMKELHPDWPRTGASASPAPTEEQAKRRHASWLRLNAPGGAPVPHPDQRPMFTEVGSRWAAEGLILGVMIALMVLWSIWNLATADPIVRPEDLGNLRTGPSEFPISVYIDRGNISFVNRSSEVWDCSVKLGRDAAKAYTATFVVKPAERCYVPYRDFRGPPARAPDSDLRTSALATGLVTCAGSSGKTRVFQW